MPPNVCCTPLYSPRCLLAHPRDSGAAPAGHTTAAPRRRGASPRGLPSRRACRRPAHQKTRNLVWGVVAGVGGYGNGVGVPTVGGDVQFHAAYNGNILVNAMCVGIARADRIFYSAASGPGNT